MKERARDEHCKNFRLSIGEPWYVERSNVAGRALVPSAVSERVFVNAGGCSWSSNQSISYEMEWQLQGPEQYRALSTRRRAKQPPMNGWLYDAMTKGPEQKLLGPIRAALLGEISGEIVELGAGTGLNFPYYPAAARVRAIEPNASMLAKAKTRAPLVSAHIDLAQGGDEVLDAIAEGTLDAVVATLVFCSVDDPTRTMQRVLRVLKPGGRFVTMEHVRDVTGWGRLQSLLTPVWCRVCANCHLDRDMERTIREAGYSSVRLQERKMPPPAFRLLYGEALR